MGLADEVLAQFDPYAIACRMVREGQAYEGQLRMAAILHDVRSRLTKIEQELDGYRQDRRAAKAAGELFLSTLTDFDGDDLG
jgi:hypothetical protein